MFFQPNIKKNNNKYECNPLNVIRNKFPSEWTVANQTGMEHMLVMGSKFLIIQQVMYLLKHGKHSLIPNIL